jgi:hypothetical protein
MTPDELGEQSAKAGIRISIRDLDELILIEGDRRALEFLGRLLIAQAESERDCGFGLSPAGPGSALFAEDSTHGFYIHLKHQGGEAEGPRRTPYSEFEGTRVWSVLSAALDELVGNQDLEETTARRYIVGLIAKRLFEAGLLRIEEPSE